MITKFSRGGAMALGLSAALCGAAMAQQYPQQYPSYPQQYAAPQYYQANPAPAHPPSWSYDPYTSGLGPCPQRTRGDPSCADLIAPTAGQPNYWVECNPLASINCEQMAVNRAYEYAEAQVAAVAQQIAQQAAVQAGPLNLPASAYEPVSVDYTTPSDHRRHRVTVKRLSSYSEPANRRICDTFTKINLDVDSGASTTSTAHRCKGPDGHWRDA